MAGDGTQRALGSVVTLQRDTILTGALAGLQREHAPSVTFKELAGIFIIGFARPVEHAAVGAQGFSDNASAMSEKTSEKKSTAAQTDPKVTPRKYQENTKKARLVDAMKAAPTASVRELAAACGLSTDSALHHIKKLKQAGQLRRIGPDKGGRWEVLPPAPDSAQRGAGHGG